MKTIEVVAAVIEDGGKILGTERGYGDYAGSWEFPGGKVELGETYEQALARELREELDAEITVDRFLSTVEFDYPKFHLIMHCYLVHLASEFTLLEHHAARWVGVDEVDDIPWLEADLKVIDQLKREGVLN